MILTTSDLIRVKIETKKNGDYIQVNQDNIEIYNVKSNVKMDKQNVILGNGIIEELKEMSYE